MMPGHNEDAVRAIVVRFGLTDEQASEFSDEIEERKSDSGKPGSENFGYYDLEEIAREMFPEETSGQSSSSGSSSGGFSPGKGFYSADAFKASRKGRRYD